MPTIMKTCDNIPLSQKIKLNEVLKKHYILFYGIICKFDTKLVSLESNPGSEPYYKFFLVTVHYNTLAKR